MHTFPRVRAEIATGEPKSQESAALDKRDGPGRVTPGRDRPLRVEGSLEIVRSLRTPAMKEQLTSQGLEAVGNSPREFGEYIKSEYAKWAKVVKSSGATVD